MPPSRHQAGLSGRQTVSKEKCLRGAPASKGSLTPWWGLPGTRSWLRGLTWLGAPATGPWRCIWGICVWGREEDRASHKNPDPRSNWLCDSNGVARVGGHPPHPLVCQPPAWLRSRARTSPRAGEPCPGPAKSSVGEERPGFTRVREVWGVPSLPGEASSRRGLQARLREACVESVQHVLRPAKGCPGPYGPPGSHTDTPKQGNPLHPAP